MKTPTGFVNKTLFFRRTKKYIANFPFNRQQILYRNLFLMDLTKKTNSIPYRDTRARIYFLSNCMLNTFWINFIQQCVFNWKDLWLNTRTYAFITHRAHVLPWCNCNICVVSIVRLHNIIVEKLNPYDSYRLYAYFLENSRFSDRPLDFTVESHRVRYWN